VCVGVSFLGVFRKKNKKEERDENRKNSVPVVDLFCDFFVFLAPTIDSREEKPERCGGAGSVRLFLLVSFQWWLVLAPPCLDDIGTLVVGMRV
jgi:hypothetical protein